MTLYSTYRLSFLCTSEQNRNAVVFSMKYVVKRKKTVKRGASTVRKEPELAIQIEIIEMLKKELKKNVCFTAFPAGGGGRVRGAKLKRAGLQAGWPDIQLISDGMFYGLEVKTKVGKLSPAQLALHKKLQAIGCSIAVVRSVSEAQEKIVDWNISRSDKQNVESSSPAIIT